MEYELGEVQFDSTSRATMLIIDGNATSFTQSALLGASILVPR